ncbi:MAG: hypothetical protein GY720_18495 [bacterium]|nr:hypothetical protein [bacterium]
MRKSFGVIVVALVAAMSFAGVALAEEADGDSESQIAAPVVVVDEESGLVRIAIPIDGELPEGCLEDDDETLTQDDDAEGDDGDEAADPEETVTYGPGDCIEFVIEHPSGKTHHGAVVSTVAKNLHPSMLNGIKKGEIMRMVAKTGKIADDGDDDDDGDGKADKEERRADQRERKAERAERKAQRKADLEERKAQRKADQAARKADRSANRGNRGKRNR